MNLINDTTNLGIVQFNQDFDENNQTLNQVNQNIDQINQKEPIIAPEATMQGHGVQLSSQVPAVQSPTMTNLQDFPSNGVTN